jgi:hypothetical protein
MKNVSTSQNSTENYRLIAFNGTRTVAAKTSQYDWQVCAIIRCLNNTLDSCSENDKTSLEAELSNFMQVKLKAGFDIENETTFLPSFNALDIHFDLIPPTLFEIETNVLQSFMQIQSSSLNETNVKTIAMINKLFEKERK